MQYLHSEKDHEKVLKHVWLYMATISRGKGELSEYLQPTLALVT